MVPVPKAMKEQLNDVPLPDGLPTVCPSCLSIWNMAKPGSKSKSAIEVNSFDELMGYCVESRLTREALARAKEATCVCGSPASLPPPLPFGYASSYDGSCQTCQSWIDSRIRRNGHACRFRKRLSQSHQAFMSQRGCKAITMNIFPMLKAEVIGAAVKMQNSL
jgi:hypothetical protein